jgi:hypothetical protein
MDANTVYVQVFYSLQSILPFANMNVSSTKMCLDTSVFVKDNMSRREYYFCSWAGGGAALYTTRE